MKHSVKEYRLDSGARGLVVSVPDSDTVEMAVSVKAGWMFADRDKFEVPHLLEHVMFGGAGKYPTSIGFKSEVEKNGASLSASTSSTDIIYSYDCVKDEAARIMDLLVMQLTDPLMPEAVFAAEVGNVREELTRNTTNHGRVCAVNLTSVMAPNSRITEVESMSQLDQIRRQDALDYYRRTHTPKNLRFFVAGSFDDEGESLVRQLEDGLSSLGEGPDYDYPTHPAIKRSSPLVEKRDIKQLYYNLTGYCDSTRLSYRERVALGLLAGLLTGGWQSWVFGEARDKGIAYSVGSWFGFQPNLASFGFSANVSPANAKALFRLIATQVERIKSGKFTDNDLKWVQDMRRGSFILRHQSPGSLLNWYYQAYVQEDLIRHPEEYLQEYGRIDRNVVIEAFNKVVGEGRWGLSLVGDIVGQDAKDLYEILQPIWLK